MNEAFYSAAIKAAWGGGSAVLKKIFKKKPLSIEEIKKRAQVLFIDDESYDSLLESIRGAGWNVRQVKEIYNFDSEEVKNADVIFVDYKDVGIALTPTEEGIGLLKTLKRKYPEKHFIFYSGYAGFIPGHEIHDIADGWIPKNSDPYVYVERIEMAAKKVYDGR
jgi:DNA-binding NarL/FixJ family response regulator